MTRLRGATATPRQAIFYGLLCALVGCVIAGVGLAFGFKTVGPQHVIFIPSGFQHPKTRLL